MERKYPRNALHTVNIILAAYSGIEMKCWFCLAHARVVRLGSARGGRDWGKQGIFHVTWTVLRLDRHGDRMSVEPITTTSGLSNQLCDGGSSLSGPAHTLCTLQCRLLTSHAASTPSHALWTPTLWLPGLCCLLPARSGDQVFFAGISVRATLSWRPDISLFTR